MNLGVSLGVSHVLLWAQAATGARHVSTRAIHIPLGWVGRRGQRWTSAAVLFFPCLPPRPQGPTGSTQSTLARGGPKDCHHWSPELQKANRRPRPWSAEGVSPDEEGRTPRGGGGRQAMITAAPRRQAARRPRLVPSLQTVSVRAELQQRGHKP